VFFILGISIRYSKLKMADARHVRKFWCGIFLNALMLSIWMAKCVSIFYFAQTDPLLLTILRTLDEIIDAILIALLYNSTVLWWFYDSAPRTLIICLAYGMVIKLYSVVYHVLYHDNVVGYVYLALSIVHCLMIGVKLELLPNPPPFNAPHEYGDALPPA